jgi:molybdopterin molybdotransferase
MLSLEQARTRILDRLPRLPTERVPLLEALDRFAAEDIRGLRAVPGFDNSAFDGYAVHSVEVASASPEHPVPLRVSGLCAAGSAPGPAFPAGSCVRIFTGAPLPAGADAIVMQEDTRSPGPGLVEFLAASTPWEGVRFAGEDVRPGDVLLRSGHRLRPGALSLIASTGVDTLPVNRRPRLSLLSTGSELIEPGQPLQPGQIHDSNGVLLESLARREGVEVLGRTRIADELEATLNALDQASRSADVIITTGGVSVGDADLLRPALAKLGGEVDLWRIAMKPGKPFAFGRLGKAWWFGLPGNPVSAFVTWRVLVRPALHRLMGSVEPATVALPARLGQPFTNRGDRRHLIRATLDTQGRVFQAGTQGSHLQAGLAHANVLLDLPAATTWEAGREVTVELLD